MLVLDRVLRIALDGQSWGYCVRERRSSRSPEETAVTDLTYADEIAAIATNFADTQNKLNPIAYAG